MKKSKKIISIFLIILILFSFGMVYGISSAPILDPDKYNPGKDITDTYTFIVMISKIIGALRIIGSLVAIVAFIVIGIKYMMGSVEEKADYKGTMGPYLIGAIMVFAIPNILGVIYDLVTGLNFYSL